MKLTYFRVILLSTLVSAFIIGLGRATTKIFGSMLLGVCASIFTFMVVLQVIKIIYDAYYDAREKEYEKRKNKDS